MTIIATVYKSPLHQMTQTTCTCLWNDSSSPTELGYAIEHGAVGATCNPVIVVDVLKREMHLWKDRILDLIRSMPGAAEHDIAWRLVDEMSIKSAELLKPIFDAHNGKNGRLSVQTDPRFYRDTAAIVRQDLPRCRRIEIGATFSVGSRWSNSRQRMSVSPQSTQGCSAR